jgi:hypothetical protein
LTTLPFFCRGIPIQPPQVLNEIQKQLDQVLLSIPSLPRSERRIIVSALQRQAIPVLQIPSVDDLTSGRARIRVSKLPPHPHGAWGDRLPARLSGLGCGALAASRASTATRQYGCIIK